MQRRIHLIGFGSQGSAWAQILRLAGWEVRVYLARPDGDSFESAQKLGFSPSLLPTLIQDLDSEVYRESGHPLVAFLIPDHLIGPVYRDFFAALPFSLTFILAHGYAVYAQEVRPVYLEHEFTLLAPKAIGPKLLEEARKALASGSNHKLVAAIQVSEERRAQLEELASALRFAPENLISASFDQETIGDLISEQGLLCGGVFTLLEWTMQKMKEAGVPPALIREECFSELELIASLIRERGPAATLNLISQAALCGATVMKEELERTDTKKAFDSRLTKVLDKNFIKEFRSGEWKQKAQNWIDQFQKLESTLPPKGDA